MFCRKSTFIFDCDGVIWKGDTILPGIIQFLSDLREMNKNVFFVTNNCMKTREEYLEKFKKLKIQAEVSQIFPSSYLSALYLSRDPNRQSVYCFGSEAMRKEMDKFEIDYFGFENENELNEIDIDRWNQFKVRKNVSHVLCGFDPHFNLTKVCMASSYVNNGAKFIVTNMDHKLPLSNPDITLPDVGAMVASVKVATEKDVDYIAGKPSRMAFEAIQSSCPGKIDSESTVMFGDRLDTDIQFGINCGLTTVLTLTGITSETDAQKSSIKPDYIIPDFTKIL